MIVNDRSRINQNMDYNLIKLHSYLGYISLDVSEKRYNIRISKIEAFAQLESV